MDDISKLLAVPAIQHPLMLAGGFTWMSLAAFSARIREWGAKSRGGQNRFVQIFQVAATNTGIKRTCDSNCSGLVQIGSSVPACSAAMYAAYQSDQFASGISCSPRAAAARRIALARSFADAKVVAAGSMRPGNRRLTSWTIHALPSGSSKETYER
jgi:hypothetical protein